MSILAYSSLLRTVWYISFCIIHALWWFLLMMIYCIWLISPSIPISVKFIMHVNDIIKQMSSNYCVNCGQSVFCGLELETSTVRFSGILNCNGVIFTKSRPTYLFGSDYSFFQKSGTFTQNPGFSWITSILMNYIHLESAWKANYFDELVIIKITFYTISVTIVLRSPFLTVRYLIDLRWLGGKKSCFDMVLLLCIMTYITDFTVISNKKPDLYDCKRCFFFSFISLTSNFIIIRLNVFANPINTFKKFSFGNYILLAKTRYCFTSPMF